MNSAGAARRAADGQPLVHSLPETARLLGKSWRTVRAMILRGELPAVELNGRQVVPAHALEALVGLGAPAAPPTMVTACDPHAVAEALRGISDGFARLSLALAAGTDATEPRRSGECSQTRSSTA